MADTRLARADLDSSGPPAHTTSVIIPCWNALPLTRICLQQVLRWTTLSFEIIAIDNGSTDGTVPWLKALRRKTLRPRIPKALRDFRIIENTKNRGYPAAMNQGIAHARGHYLLFGNNDAAVAPFWLESMSQALCSRPRVGGVAPCSNPRSPLCGKRPWHAQGLYRGIRGMERFAAAQSLRSRHASYIPAQGFIPGHWFLTKRSVINRVGLFDESFHPGGYEDWDLQLRMLNAGYGLGFAGRAYVHHVWFGCAERNGLAMSEFYSERRRRRLYRKHPQAVHITMASLAPADDRAGAIARPRETVLRPLAQRHPSMLAIYITSRCNIRCASCAYSSSPKTSDSLSLTQVRFCIDQAKTISSIKTIAFSGGGEPFVVYHDLKAAVSYAARQGFHVHVVTNAFWARNRAEASRILKELKTAGLSSISISYDDFHAEFIPFKNVAHAVGASLELKLDAKIAVVVAPGSLWMPETIIYRLLKAGIPFAKIKVTSSSVIPTGRAIKTKPAAQWTAPKGPYADCDWRIGCPSIMSLLAVLPSGDILPCCACPKGHLSLGNVFRTPLKSILKAARASPLWHWLAAEGPSGISNALRLAGSLRGPRDKFVHLCQACESILGNPKHRNAVQKLARERTRDKLIAMP